MQQSKSYVRTDEYGVMRVGATRVMLDSVVAGFQQGHSPETIQQQYPALSLEEVYGAIAWYLAHTEEAEQYLARQAAVWNPHDHCKSLIFLRCHSVTFCTKCRPRPCRGRTGTPGRFPRHWDMAKD
jgi:uncharacterized protein (DUF433 family)